MSIKSIKLINNFLFCVNYWFCHCGLCWLMSKKSKWFWHMPWQRMLKWPINTTESPVTSQSETWLRKERLPWSKSFASHYWWEEVRAARLFLLHHHLHLLRLPPIPQVVLIVLKKVCIPFCFLPVCQDNLNISGSNLQAHSPKFSLTITPNNSSTFKIMQIFKMYFLRLRPKSVKVTSKSQKRRLTMHCLDLSIYIASFCVFYSFVLLQKETKVLHLILSSIAWHQSCISHNQRHCCKLLSLGL